MIKTFLILFLAFLVFLHARGTTYTYKTVGNLTIEALVFSPNLPKGQLSPVLFAIPSGGFLLCSKTRSLSSQEINEALSRNWTIVSIDYRLAPAALLKDIVEDAQDAYEWVRTNLSQIEPINPDIISVVGRSAGGGLALISGYKFVPRPKAIIAFYPYLANFNDPFVSDLATPPSEELLAAMRRINQSVAEYFFKEPSDPRYDVFEEMCWEKKEGWALISRDPEESAESIEVKLRELSAVDNVDKNYPPTYLAHGLQDIIVLFTQSVQMAKKLEEMEVEFVLDLVLGKGHSFDFADPSEETWKEHVLPAFDFVAKFMK